MPLQQSDEDAILAAIARGEQSVRFADGRQVTYRSVTELQAALAIARQERTIPMNRSTLAITGRD